MVPYFVALFIGLTICFGAPKASSQDFIHPVVVSEIASPSGERLTLKSFAISGHNEIRRYFSQVGHGISGFHLIRSGVAPEHIKDIMPLKTYENLDQNAISLAVNPRSEPRLQIEGLVVTIMESAISSSTVWYFGHQPIETKILLASIMTSYNLLYNLRPDLLDKYLFTSLRSYIRGKEATNSIKTSPSDFSKVDQISRLPVMFASNLAAVLAIQTILDWSTLGQDLSWVSFSLHALTKASFLTFLNSSWDTMLQDWREKGSPYFSPKTAMRLIFAKGLAFSVLIARLQLGQPDGYFFAGVMGVAGLVMLKNQDGILRTLVEAKTNFDSGFYDLSKLYSQARAEISSRVLNHNRCGPFLN
jgi:hypothetical protein